MKRSSPITFEVNDLRPAAVATISAREAPPPSLRPMVSAKAQTLNIIQLLK